MAGYLKSSVKRILPPIAIDLMRWGLPVSNFGTIAEWEAVAVSQSAWNASDGWSHPSIVRIQTEKWEQFLKSARAPSHLGSWPLGGEDVAFHNLVMTFGYVIGRASCGRADLSILDWGGGLGHFYVYATELFPNIAFDYTIKELPAFCNAGRELLRHVKFVSEESAALAGSYDLVFASSSVHYCPDFYSQLGKLAECANSWFMVTRLPCVLRHRDFVVVQRPHNRGYLTEYPCWFVNRGRFVGFVESRGFTLEREFFQSEAPVVLKAPEQCRYAGFLFRRIKDDRNRARPVS
jgi:putative methyltransferase (TIGR04325 family)